MVCFSSSSSSSLKLSFSGSLVVPLMIVFFFFSSLGSFPRKFQAMSQFMLEKHLSPYIRYTVQDVLIIKLWEMNLMKCNSN